jgi:hypothetical protein
MVVLVRAYSRTQGSNNHKCVHVISASTEECHDKCLETKRLPYLQHTENSFLLDIEKMLVK